MACQAVQMWSLSDLVAAFLDLAIAYLLLCASTVAYLASKFLGFFGLNLPCPCDGIVFNIHSKSLCLNRLLLDFPTQKVSEVQLSVKQKFPFSDSLSPKKHDYSVNGDKCVNGILEMEGEASCSSVSDARRSIDVVRREMSAGAGKYDMKGKGVMSLRPRSRLRHRKGGGGHGKYSSVSSYDHPIQEEVLVRQRAVTSVEMNHSPDEDMHIKKSILSIEELEDNPQSVQSFSGDEKNAIRLLEQTLEEERIACSALYIELEKERSAAATAADEAMAMILRLQAEKASIEMEARQYQRIIEEKSAYDAEEMNILKEIIVRREKEKHFLEKEVEAFRQMVSVGNEQLAGDGSDKKLEQIQEMNMGHKLAEKIIIACNGTETGDPYYDPSVKQQAKDALLEFSDSCDLMLAKDPHVYDVHIIGDGINFCSEANADKSKQVSVSSSSIVRERNSVPFEAVTKKVKVITDCPSTSRLETEVDVKESSSEITRGLPPIGPRGLSLLSELKRSSLSTVDSEMLKIDSEVGRLRERLKLVQEGREKLGLSVENRERENIQLKLLEDIARQIQEIRHLTEPGKAARQPTCIKSLSLVLVFRT
ncbi:hypothetical protein Pfo_026637 [Paulownia fortunei]|nr:hypothetical protein Pfo_026637 [Paulownia fortunei]